MKFEDEIGREYQLNMITVYKEYLKQQTEA